MSQREEHKKQTSFSWGWLVLVAVIVGYIAWDEWRDQKYEKMLALDKEAFIEQLQASSWSLEEKQELLRRLQREWRRAKARKGAWEKALRKTREKQAEQEQAGAASEGLSQAASWMQQKIENQKQRIAQLAEKRQYLQGLLGKKGEQGD